jgi:hypothetical protein
LGNEVSSAEYGVTVETLELHIKEEAHRNVFAKDFDHVKLSGLPRDKLACMADKIYAQHADVNRFHLETRAVDSKWTWKVVDIQTKEIKGSGIVPSLQAAKEAAENAAGGVASNWTSQSAV